MTTAPDRPLTDRQLRFVFEYLIDQNASAAAVRAGYSEKSRASQANELMNNQAVRERIRIELSSLLAEAGCSELQLIMERKRAAFFRAVKMFRTGWEVLPLDEMEEETRRALEVSTVMGKGGPVVKVRQPDRNKALRALERVHERLEKINQAHYARMEREGRCKSLEEIDAMDEAYVKAEAESAEKSQDFLGGGQGTAPFDRLRANGPEYVDFEKPSGASGFGQGIAPEAGLGADGGEGVFAEKPSVSLGSVEVAGPASDRFAEKGQVLSGSAATAGALADPIPLRTMALSGSGIDGGKPEAAFCEKSQVFSGWRHEAPAASAQLVSGWLLRNAPAPSERLRVA